MILLGLGSNIGNRELNLQKALCLLEADSNLRIDKVSSIYETAPFGVTDQADFLNMVATVVTSLSPMELLKKCLMVEDAMGRIRTRRWGPRIIDIDLLVYDNASIQDEALKLPHPGIAERAFVLVPLREVAMKLQETERSAVQELISGSAEISGQGVRLWKSVDWDSGKRCFV